MERGSSVTQAVAFRAALSRSPRIRSQTRGGLEERVREAGVAEPSEVGLRPGPIPHPGEERHGEGQQLRRGALLRERLVAGREGALGITAVFEIGDPGDPGADDMQGISEAAGARFEPPGRFLFLPESGERVGIGASEVLVVLGQAGADPVAEQGARLVALIPEKVRQIMPGAGADRLAPDEPEEQGFGLLAGVAGKPQQIGVIVDVAVGRVYPILLRLEAGQHSRFDDVFQGLPHQRAVPHRMAGLHVSDADVGRLRELPDELLQLAQGLTDLTVLERSAAASIYRDPGWDGNRASRSATTCRAAEGP